MANPRAVIFSTDGQRDYVTTPDGQKYILGIVSVLSIVAKLVPRGAARRALDEFNKLGETMVPLDVEAMFEMLAPRPCRRAKTLIESCNRTLTEECTMSSMKVASYDVLASNSSIAETIIQQVAETSDTVDRLVQAQRKFNASKVREDLHSITARVAEILENVDLAQPWVSNDLNDLARQAAHIHGLFQDAK